MGPTFSVCMITYNSSRFIAQAIASVLDQTYDNFELIICDDCSSDNTWDLIDSFTDDRIRKFRNSKNIGEYANRDKVIGISSGEYLIFIDGDDIVYPNGLAFVAGFLTRYPDCGMIVSRPWDERLIFPLLISPHDFYCFEYLDKGILGINFTKVVFKRKILKASGNFPTHVRLGDMYLQYAVGRTCYTLVIPDASTWWRRTPGQASEKLLNNYAEYLKHEMWIKLEMLENPDCPLDHKEKDAAYENIYGNFLRYCARLLVSLRIKDLVDLLHRYQVPARFLRSILVRQNRNYFRQFNGNNPWISQ